MRKLIVLFFGFGSIMYCNAQTTFGLYNGTVTTQSQYTTEDANGNVGIGSTPATLLPHTPLFSVSNMNLSSGYPNILAAVVNKCIDFCQQHHRSKYQH